MKSFKFISIILLAINLPMNLFAQDPLASNATPVATTTGVPAQFFSPTFYLLVLLFIVMFISIVVLSRVLMMLSKNLLQTNSSSEPIETTIEEVKKPSFWTRFDRAVLTKAVPIEKEKDIMFEHAHDGIYELDNDLPPWWKYGFYLTIIWAFLYLLNYHVLGTGKLQLAEYKEELAIAETAKQERMALMKNNVNEETVIALNDVEAITAGKDIFTKNCVACHGQSAEGMVGPNLTDEFWIHGGGIKNVFKTITNGVPAKGMISWKSQLSAIQIQSVASYILTLKGTNPANPKAPEGNKWEEVTTTTDSTIVNNKDSVNTASNK